MLAPYIFGQAMHVFAIDIVDECLSALRPSSAPAGIEGSVMSSMNDTAAPQSGAERMRRYRKRQRDGERCVRILIGRAEIDRLIDKGYLGPEEREDADALEFAASSFISEALLSS
jgi:hypothetical protein